MSGPPNTRFCTTRDGDRVAYKVFGGGSLDLLVASGIQCIDLMWEEPSFAHTMGRLSHLGRVICMDPRGMDSSDAIPHDALPTPEEWLVDFIAVLDELDSSEAVLVADTFAGLPMLTLAATYPERTKALVLVNAFPYLVREDGYPHGIDPSMVDLAAEFAPQVWGVDAFAGAIAPSRAGDENLARWIALVQRLQMRPRLYQAVMRFCYSLDFRPVLPTIRVPTLVLESQDRVQFDPYHLVGAGQYMADHMPNATFVALPGADPLFYTGDVDRLMDEIEEFLTGIRPTAEPDRVLATVLFTDIVGSTEHAERLGDKAWTDLLDRHDALVAHLLERHSGRKINQSGDGLLATFDGPARGVRCAQAICSAVRSLGIEVRAGLHTGEVEVRGDDIGGVAVHIGARVAALARTGEVLVSRTIKDLVAGSRIEFVDRGEHQLKGIVDTWQLFAVTSA